MRERRTLVIACGNPLRQDDGIGAAAAQIVAAWNLPGVAVKVVHQLVPELIDDMIQANRVLFIDATIGRAGRFACDVVSPHPSRHALGHHMTPGNLLALLDELGEPVPEAWLLTIPAVAFDHGEPLTDAARNSLNDALAWIREWLTEAPTCMKSA